MTHYGHAAIGKMIVSAIIHAVIYGAVWRIFRQLTTPEIVILTIGVVGILWLASRRRSY